MVLADPWEAEGVNDRSQLATLGRIKNQRICESWMRNGVTIIDPATTWIEDGVDIATDVTLLPGTQLEGATTIHAGAVIGPDTTLRDAEVGQDAKVVRTHGLLATIGDRASVGPFVHLRPGTEIEADARVAAFVDLRDAHISEGERVAPCPPWTGTSFEPGEAGARRGDGDVARPERSVSLRSDFGRSATPPSSPLSSAWRPARPAARHGGVRSPLGWPGHCPPGTRGDIE